MKSGIITLAGRSNVGKSTLLNALVGTKAAITSPLPQTTREPIRGILNDPRGQIVIVDAPGIFETGRGPLTSAVNAAAREALHGVDAIVYVVDPTREIGTEEHRIHSLIAQQTPPKILAINKSDLPSRERKWREQYLTLANLQSPTSNFQAVCDISALKEQHLKPLMDVLFDILPEGEPLYPTDQRADVPKQYWISECIREKVFLTMTDEIPYTVTVVVDDITDRPNGTLAIAARIVTTQDKYKKMLIGAGGQRIKQIGSMAREDMEMVFRQKVFLELHVVVDPKWQR